MSEKELSELSGYISAILEILDQLNPARDGPDD